MTITQPVILEQVEEKEYGFIPDKGCKWGGDSCLDCSLPECVYINPKMKKLVKEINNMITKDQENSFNKMFSEVIEFDISTGSVITSLEPVLVSEDIPAVDTCYMVKKGRSKYVGTVGTVKQTRLNEKAKGGVEVRLSLMDGNHKWFNLQSLKETF